MIRKVMFATGLAALTLTLTAPVSAEDTAKRTAEEKKICRSERITGSLTRVRRICMTEAEWKALHDHTREDMAKIQGSAAGGQCAGSNPMSGGRC